MSAHLPPGQQTFDIPQDPPASSNTAISLYYNAIRDFYGTRRAIRSGVPLINHIDEGLRVLDAIGASELAKKAFCLHPIFQSDSELVRSWDVHPIGHYDPYVVLLAMEYRGRANAGLSNHVTLRRGKPYWEGEPPSPGPLREVRDMLIADKVQNFADFEIYHGETHLRRVELRFYFQRWLRVLRIDEAEYERLKKVMKP